MYKSKSKSKYKNPSKAKVEAAKKARDQKVSDVTQKIIDLFTSGDVPKAITIATYAKHLGIPCSEWSLANRIIMQQQGTSDARGIQQWNAIGRRIKKGSKAISIFTPKMLRKKKEEETGESVKENCEGTEDSDQKFFLAGFLPIPVFKAEDTDGEPLEYKEHEVPNLPLMDKAREWGIDVRAISFHGNFYGQYRSGGTLEEIRLATPSEKTFFHELSHAAHKRVMGNLVSGQNPRQEIVAELCAQVLAQIVGTEIESTVGNSYIYIKGYAEKMGKDVGRACLSVLSEVEKVLKLVLE